MRDFEKYTLLGRETVLCISAFGIHIIRNFILIDDVSILFCVSLVLFKKFVCQDFVDSFTTNLVKIAMLIYFNEFDILKNGNAERLATKVHDNIIFPTFLIVELSR